MDAVASYLLHTVPAARGMSSPHSPVRGISHVEPASAGGGAFIQKPTLPGFSTVLMPGSPTDRDNSVYTAAQGPPRGLLAETLVNTMKTSYGGHPGTKEWRRVLEMPASRNFLERLENSKADLIRAMFNSAFKWKACLCAIAQGSRLGMFFIF